MTLGDALASLRTGAHPQGIGYAKWCQQVIEGYPKDTLFAKILENPGDYNYKAFWVSKNLI